MGYNDMFYMHLPLPVLVVVGVLLSFTLMSIYVSRVYLPAKIKRAYVKSITALAAAVETKEFGTIGHAQRVAHLTKEMARRLGVVGQHLERIEYAGLLMDIGKASVPQRLLNKTEPLTAQEWNVLQRHPRLGAEMIAAVPFLADLADYVHYHHEYWDGSGYPEALVGEQIPLASRILSVAADFEAMVSERPYHMHPWTREDALAEIRHCVGTKYDPAVVDVFCDLVVEDLILEQGIGASEVPITTAHSSIVSSIPR